MTKSRFFVPLLLGMALAAAPASAANELSWHNDTVSGTIANLWFGVPESDELQFAATCTTNGEAGDELLMATFGTDVHGLKEGATAIVDVAIGKQRATLKGKVHGTKAEVGITGVRAPIAIDNEAFWGAMQKADALTYARRGGDKLRMNLGGASGPVQKFLADCDSIARTGSVVAGAGEGADAGASDQGMPTDTGEAAGSDMPAAGGAADSGGGNAAENGTAVSYTCDEGIPMQVVYTTKGEEMSATVTHDVAGTVTLKRAISGSGVRYSDGEFELFTKGPEAIFSWKDGQHRCLED